MSTNTERYNAVAVALHWAIAILIIGQIAGGLYMHNLPNSSAIKFDLYQFHKSFGLSVLILTIVRLGWRLSHRAPALPSAMPQWEKLVARATHWAFYGLMVLTPLAGWVMVSVSPTDIPTKYFGVIPVPHLPFFGGVVDREAAEDLWKEIHEYLAFTILFLLALHVGAALKHHFFNKDGVLRSMLPFGAKSWGGIAAIFGVLVLGSLVYLAVPSVASNNASFERVEGGNWAVNYDASTLRFIGEEKGKPFTGEFQQFSANINFDPEALDQSVIEVTVATPSATTGDSLRDSNIPSKEWFDTKSYDQARFTSTEIRQIGDDRYAAHGVLAIKSFEQPITLEFELTIDGNNARANGGVDLIRTNYGLGENDDWLNEEQIALNVRVEFTIEATRRN
ncbi:cytochrome b/b6 domain-containing protein [Hyphococcus sp. DH-69]|uniref:cytochrome b/b6 domain-containing protein n=1 Tax=Hyphococcus formosus TaxID=3143534 RepID=UPI00398A7A7C